MGGGGYNSYPQLRHNLLSVKDSSNAGEVLHTVLHYANYGTKTKYKKLSRTTQIMLWLLVFSIFAVFSLCPLAGLATRYNLTAGGPSENTFYLNAPVFVAGHTNRDATTGSADTSTGVLNATATNKPLFKTDGTVDLEVLADLLNMVDSENVWNGVTENANDPTYLSAKNFGKYGTQNGWTDAQKGNAQILVKLFEDAGNSSDTNKINEATSQYWQAVYRSVNGKNDVLTLYMCCPYTNAQFNPNSDTTYNSKTYRYEANYSQSYLRDKTVKPLYETLNSTYSALDQYVVAPSQLVADSLNLGGWQSSTYQTSYDSNRTLYSTNNGVGSSGYMDGRAYYGLENGMDGLSGKHSNWNGTVASVYDDKLWVPSAFEVLHTGYGKDSTSQIQDTGRLFDENNDLIYLDSNYLKATAGIDTRANTSSHTNANRTGLWELNGYDRATDSYAWLRSGHSGSDISARGIDPEGDRLGGSVDTLRGVRVALHLNLSTLGTLLQKTKLSITATNNAVNSLLVLTIMDGDARLAEYSCISGTITPRITLDWNKTYKILATRPFGSSLEVKLDNVLQSPTIFACYEISTAENVRMKMLFTLTGDGSWKNCIVV